jgi:hypothetical protein
VLGSGMASKQVKSLLRRLARLRKLDTEFAVHGADPRSGHGYRLDPPLDEAELRALEAKRKVQLPAGYREFVLQAGDGGAGPGYGLGSAKKALASRRLKLQRPFPYSNEVAREAIRVRASGEDEHHFLPEPAFEGLIELCDMGCAQTCSLVVTGEQAGAIWGMGEFGCYPEFQLVAGEPRPHTFLSWYEAWLDSSLALVEG